MCENIELKCNCSNVHEYARNVVGMHTWLYHCCFQVTTKFKENGKSWENLTFSPVRALK